MAEHTPGPWIDWSTMEWLREPQKLLANTDDARLIAAAPELLEALQLVWDTYGMDPSVDSSIWQTVRAAISKATGAAQ